MMLWRMMKVLMTITNWRHLPTLRIMTMCGAENDARNSNLREDEIKAFVNLGISRIRSATIILLNAFRIHAKAKLFYCRKAELQSFINQEKFNFPSKSKSKSCDNILHSIHIVLYILKNLEGLLLDEQEQYSQSIKYDEELSTYWMKGGLDKKRYSSTLLTRIHCFEEERGITTT